MPCYSPRVAWKKRGVGGKIALTLTPPKGYDESLRVPCQKCIGCQQTRAREWAFRCQHEHAEHPYSLFTTLTQAEVNLHPTLSKEIASAFIKRLREHTSRKLQTNGAIRYFLSGEYGTLQGRPHYHAIIFNARADLFGQLIQDTWRLGFTHTVDASPEAIAYVAGYTAKKADWLKSPQLQHLVNPNTGEIYEYQPEFLLMSRGGRQGHGIGGKARQYTESWRTHAYFDGYKIKVPRYYHEAWKLDKSPIDIYILQDAKTKHRQTQEANHTPERLEAAQKIAEYKQQQAQQRRKLE